MARFVKKLGTQQMRFQFDIELHSISLSVPYECNIQIVWKKDQKRLESKNKPTIGSGDVPGSASFADEKLSMISGLYKDPKKGTFSEKSSQLVVKVLRGEKARSCGMVSLNLASYISAQLGQGQAGSFKEMLSMPIEKCPDAHALLHFTVSSQIISITSGSETMSMMSGMCGAADVMSIDSGPESEFKFQDLDEAGNGRKGKRAPGLKVGREIPQEANEHDEIASAYGLPGRKVQIKRRSQSSQQQIKKVVGAGGIPRPPTVDTQKEGSKIGATSGGLDADQIMQGSTMKPKDFLQGDLEEIEERVNPCQEDAPDTDAEGKADLFGEGDRQQAEDATPSTMSASSVQKKTTHGKVIKLSKSKIHLKTAQGSSSPTSAGAGKHPSTPASLSGSQAPAQSAKLDSISSKIKIKLQTKMQHKMEEQVKSTYEEALSNAIEAKAQQTQYHMTETVSYQKKIDCLVEEKTALNDKYQKQLNQVLREKEELVIAQSSQEDKIQKMELDREHLKLKNKQMSEDYKKLEVSSKANQVNVITLKEDVDKIQQKLDYNQQAMVQEKKQMEKDNSEKLDKLQVQIDGKDQLYRQTSSEIRERDQTIQDMQKLEKKLRMQIEDIQKSQSYNQSQNEQQLNKKIAELDQKNEQLTKEISQHIMKQDKLQQQLQESTKTTADLNFKLEFANHKSEDEAQKNTALLAELNNMSIENEKIKKEREVAKKDTEDKIAKLTRDHGESDLTMSAQERRIKDKDRKISQLESKIIELQEDGVSRINEYENELSGQKQLFEHQISEYKKRVAEMEQLVTTAKQQVKRVQEDKVADIQLLETELRELKAQTSEEIHVLEEQNNELQSQLQQTKRSEDLQQSGPQYKLEIAKLKQEIKDLKALNTGFGAAPSRTPEATADGSQAAGNGPQQTAQLKLQLREQMIRANDLENQLVEAKMQWANLDMENDELTLKLQQKNQMLKVFSSQVTKLECELVQAKQQMGDALNQVHEYEQGLMDQGASGTPGVAQSAPSRGSGIAQSIRNTLNRGNQNERGRQTESGRKSEESGGEDQTQNDVGMFYEAGDQAMMGSSGDGGHRRGDKRRDGEPSAPQRSPMRSPLGAAKFNVPNLFKSLKTKMDKNKKA